jgi:hypothetical protein
VISQIHEKEEIMSSVFWLDESANAISGFSPKNRSNLGWTTFLLEDLDLIFNWGAEALKDASMNVEFVGFDTLSEGDAIQLLLHAIVMIKDWNINRVILNLRLNAQLDDES